MKRNSQQGIALIITLILLSVITFLAITFLILSRREHGSVATTTDQNTAKFAADAALADAQAQLIAPMLAFSNDQAYGLLVSTNYINRAGFASGVANPTNVNYDYYSGGSTNWSQGDFEQNVANLEYTPRPPVYISTNTDATFPNDFRFYLDLNRNGRYDTNGTWPEIGTDGLPIVNGGVTNMVNFVGDPEWIGILEHPDQPHSSSNFFLARYAYFVVPTTKTLDVNATYNSAWSRSLNSGSDGFFRNQGVGSWEINLAAFLADLNTNYWDTKINPYSYLTPGNFPNKGAAFDDAQAILSYRYGNAYGNLRRADALFPNGAAVFQNDNIDEYSDGLLMTSNSIIDEFNNSPDPIGQSWAGADNPNHFFTTQDLFDRTKFPQPFPNFVDRLTQAGLNNDSYDRYTFYRLLSQLGTSSDPESGKININYRNVDANGNVVPDMETNLLAWNDPTQFFTNAAAAMFKDLNLRDAAGNLITYNYIPIYPTNYYTPAVHRILQLVANIYDATTNRSFGATPPYPYFPSVFRPFFRRDNNNTVFIAGYREVRNAAIARQGTEPIMVDLQASLGAADGINNIPILTPGQPFIPDPSDQKEPMVYGFPLVIGAKKGLPNFNELISQTAVVVSRKLEFRRSTVGGPVTSTNLMYTMAMTNLFGAELWNSYSNAFPRRFQVWIPQADVTITLTNSSGILWSNRIVAAVDKVYNPSFPWPGFNQDNPIGDNFQIPFVTNSIVMPWGTYRDKGTLSGDMPLRQPPFGPTTGFSPNQHFVALNNNFEQSATVGFPAPQFWLNVRTRLVLAIVDATVFPRRIVDYVNLDEVKTPGDVTGKLMENADCINSRGVAADAWCTNRLNGPSSTEFVPTEGIMDQIRVSAGPPPPLFGLPSIDWADPNNNNDLQQGFFYFNLFNGSKKPGDPNNYSLTNKFYAPYAPARTVYALVDLQANDPLVHYTRGDLTDLNLTNNFYTTDTQSQSNSLGSVNDRYNPWGGGVKGSAGNPIAFIMAIKDPSVRGSDDWDFPTNKFPNVGWLGRVHRGTPWQTVYMKSSGIDTNTWTQWTGDNQFWPGDTNNLTPDINFNYPTDDRMLFDVFTTAPNDNATRGQLSVNQTNLAAWSAVLSGVVVLTNDPTTSTVGWTTIGPAGVYNSALSLAQQTNVLARIWQGINAARGNTNLAAGPVFPGGVFPRLGDVLAAPQLSDASPFLN